METGSRSADAIARSCAFRDMGVAFSPHLANRVCVLTWSDMSKPYLWCATACAVAFACSSGAGPTRVGDQPSWRQDADSVETQPMAGPGGRQAGNNGPTSAENVAPKPPQAMVFTPGSPAAPMYNAKKVGEVPSSPLADGVLARVDQICKELGIPAPRPDPRLYRAATDIAAIVPEDEPLSYSLIEFAMQRHGIIEPSPHMLPVAGSLDDTQDMIEEMVARLPSLLASDPVNRLGIGAARGSKPGEDLLVLLLQASHVETEPIPREVAKNGTYVIDGRALGDFTELDIFVTREDGVVVRQDIKRRGKQGFYASLSCRGRDGRQQVEITAENARGSAVLANFPVWCGANAPTTLRIEPSVDDLVPVNTVADAEALMLKLVNRDRKRYKLPPLALSVELSAVARAHSDEMRDTGVVAHTSATTGTAQDRVRRARIATSLVMENIARAYGVGEAQEGLMNSPGHRSNLLSDKSTHAGIGIAFKETETEGRIMFVTQLFMRVPPVLSASEALLALRARIGQEKPRMRERPELSSAAQEYADKVIAPRLKESQAAAWRSARLDGLKKDYARVATAVVAVLDLDNIDMDDAFSEGWISHYGVGVAKAPDPELGKNALHVVLLLAQTR